MGFGCKSGAHHAYSSGTSLPQLADVSLEGEPRCRWVTPHVCKQRRSVVRKATLRVRNFAARARGIDDMATRRAHKIQQLSLLM